MRFSKVRRRNKIRAGIRAKIQGTNEVPRLAVYRSNKAIYCQLIDDLAGVTLASASSRGESSGTKTETAKKIGMQLAEKAKALNIEKVVFDRAGYLYHGRVKALAEGAREGGLQF
jgi:large subunit ribosomal protein L18